MKHNEKIQFHIFLFKENKKQKKFHTLLRGIVPDFWGA